MISLMLWGVGLILFISVLFLLSDSHKTDRALKRLFEKIPNNKEKIIPVFKSKQFNRFFEVIEQLDEKTKRVNILIAILLPASLLSMFGMSLQTLGWIVLTYIAVALLLFFSETHLKKRDHLEKVERFMPGLLMHMSSQCLITSDLYTVIEQAERRSIHPIKSYFSRILELLKKGRPVPEALELVNKEINCQPFNDLCLILMFYAKYGGDLERSLTVLRKHIESQRKVTETIAEKTSSIFVTGAIMQIILLVVVYNAWSALQDRVAEALQTSTGMMMVYAVIGLCVLFWVVIGLSIVWLRRL